MEDKTEYYVHCNDEGCHLGDLSGLNISGIIFERGIDYYKESRVQYLCLDNGWGQAVVEGAHPYEVEFQYQNGLINDLLCDCPCGYTCKHEAAVLLQLKETLSLIEVNHFDKWKTSGYFAIVHKPMFYTFAISANPKMILRLD